MGLLLLASVTALRAEVVVPPLPDPMAPWHADPWQADGDADPLLTMSAAGETRIGPFISGGQPWSLRLTDRRTAPRATSDAGIAFPVQRFFRRIVIGPIGPGGTAPPATGAHHWVLVRQGRARLLTREGEPMPIEHELAFDLRFDGIDLTGLDEETRRRWIDAFWDIESRRWEEAGHGKGPTGD